jgi:hypothetical protein
MPVADLCEVFEGSQSRPQRRAVVQGVRREYDDVYEDVSVPYSQIWRKVMEIENNCNFLDHPLARRIDI